MKNYSCRRILLLAAGLAILSPAANRAPAEAAEPDSPQLTVNYSLHRRSLVPAGESKPVAYLLLEPKGPSRARFPLLIFLYGSGGSIDAYNLKRPSYDRFRQRLAEKGYLILVPELGPAHWMDARARSLLDQMVAQVARDYPLDRQRVEVMGTSMGGASSLAYAIHRPDLIRAVCAVLPITDLRQWYRQTPAYRKPLAAAFGGTPETAAAAFREASAIDNLPAFAKIPVFIVAGEKDRIVPPASSRKFAQALAARGSRVIYRETKGIAHQDAAFAPYADEVADFFESAAK